MMLLLKTLQRLLPGGLGTLRRGFNCTMPTLAAGCFQDYATLCERCGATPSVCSPSSGVGIPA